jgi:hypothetical protein
MVFPPNVQSDLIARVSTESARQEHCARAMRIWHAMPICKGMWSVLLQFQPISGDSEMPTRLERLVCIKQEIDRGGYPDVQKLCAMFEIQPRTLHEDIRMMREMMGLEIRHDKYHNGYINLRVSLLALAVCI